MAIDTEQAKKLMWLELPISSSGVVYDRISALIFRKDGVFKASAELTDKEGNSVTIASLQHIETIGMEDAVDGSVDEDLFAAGTDLEDLYRRFMENLRLGRITICQEFVHDMLRCLINVDNRICELNAK